jgi:hypothetical protein
MLLAVGGLVGSESRHPHVTLNLSWTVHMRCLDDGREGLKHEWEYGFRRELDLETLVSDPFSFHSHSKPWSRRRHLR